MLADQVDGDLVIRSAGDDHVGELLGGHAELLKCRLHKVDVLMEHLGS